MKLKNIRIPVSANTTIIALGLLALIAIDRGCSGHGNVDTSDIDKEINAAKTSLDSLSDLQSAAAANRDMYRHKCDSLCPVIGVQEDAADRARKDAQWRQYRDSVSKYGDRAIDLEIARDWAKLRVDTLVAKRDIMKMR